jgi:Prp8 binding protein
MSARNSSALLKRARVDDEDDANTGTTMTISSSGGEGLGKNALVRSVKRTSGLTAPIVSLAGAHEVSSFSD